MTSKLTITRERMEEIILDNSASLEEFMAITRIALAAMDSEPVAWTWHHLKQWHVTNDEERARDLAWDGVKVDPLYRHAQPAPVVPQDVLEALQKVARIRLDLNDFDGDRRGIADCLGDSEEALIEVVNRRAAMLAASQHDTPALNSLQSVDSVADRWIPVSERMPENDGAYLCWDNRYVTTYAFIFGAWQANQFIAKNITHWMPLPATPQEVK